MARRKGFLAKILVNLVFSSATVGVAYAQPTAVPSGNAAGSGLALYYEIYGGIQDAGQPLIQIDGGVSSNRMFGAIAPEFAEKRHAIGVDLQTHGRIADIDRPLSFKALENLPALVFRLRIEQVDLMGCTLGGEIALRVAIPHPRVMSKLVVAAAMFRREGCLASFCFRV